MHQLPQHGREIHILVWGATQKAEAHILTETKSFHELGLLLPSFDITVWLTGPEILENADFAPSSAAAASSSSSSPPPSLKFPLPDNMKVYMRHLDPPCAGPFLAAHPEFHAGNCLQVRACVRACERMRACT
jgi:hypothetical protein